MERPERLTEQDFAQVWRLMEESFPIDERRTREGQRQLLLNPYYRLYGIRREGGMRAFAAVWKLPELMFVEHLAVDPLLRNAGTGAALLEWVCGLREKPVVLEVEPPADTLTARRIGFYKRNGFSLNAYYYVQPALSEAGGEIPLLLISRPGRLAGSEFLQVRGTLYRHVYGIREECPAQAAADSACRQGKEKQEGKIE